MNNYESIIIINTTLEESKRNEIIDKIKSLIEEKGKLNNVEEWR